MFTVDVLCVDNDIKMIKLTLTFLCVCLANWTHNIMLVSNDYVHISKYFMCIIFTSWKPIMLSNYCVDI